MSSQPSMVASCPRAATQLPSGLSGSGRARPSHGAENPEWGAKAAAAQGPPACGAGRGGVQDAEAEPTEKPEERRTPGSTVHERGATKAEKSPQPLRPPSPQLCPALGLAV